MFGYVTPVVSDHKIVYLKKNFCFDDIKKYTLTNLKYFNLFVAS